MASPKGLDANLSSLPKDPGNPSPMSDVASLVELMKTQMKAAKEREMRMASMLESALKPSADGRSQPVQVTPSPSTRAVSAECPMLLSSATLADFVSWEEAWTDYAKCQHLANQDRETRVSAVHQSFDEDIRRYVRQGIIGVPTNADVPDVIASVKAYVRCQRNSFSWIESTATTGCSSHENRLIRFSLCVNCFTPASF